jgi:hypothetical protein
LTRLRKDIRRLYVADVDLLPDPVPARVFLPTLLLVVPYVCAVYSMSDVKEDGGTQSARESYKQTTRWLECTSPTWSSGNMVDVRFERLAKLGSYEWRETVSVK